MLILSRKRDQRIVIGDDVEIVVVGIQGNRVQLGFDAPGDVQIHRTEIHERMQSEKVIAPGDAAGSTPERRLL